MLSAFIATNYAADIINWQVPNSYHTVKFGEGKVWQLTANLI